MSSSVIHTYKLDEIRSYTDKLENNVVLMISATFCPPCSHFTPIFESVSEEFKGQIIFIKVSIDKNPNLNDWVKVGSVPTLIYWKNGKEVYRAIGGCTKQELINRIRQIFFLT